MPDNETAITIKFADWIGAGASMATGGNMRMPSAQADNAGATIGITDANTYSMPTLRMTRDLDTGLPGLQVQITVEMQIPPTAASGAYGTRYGLRSAP